MSSTDYNIRYMTKEEAMSVVPKLSQAEEWSYGLHDVEILYDYDPTTYMCGEVHGDIVATISGLKWDRSYAFLSAFIVRADQRRKGYGAKLLAKLRSTLGDCNLAIDSVESEQSANQKGGFVKAYDHYVVLGEAKHIDHPLHKHVCDLAEVPLADVVAYDTQHFPVPRPKFVELFTRQPGGVAKAFVKDEKLMGYGTLTPGNSHPLLTPLYAANEEVAYALLSSLTNTITPGQTYEMCTHTPNVHSANMCTAFGLVPHALYTRMYNKKKYELRDNNIFACTSTDFD